MGTIGLIPMLSYLKKRQRMSSRLSLPVPIAGSARIPNTVVHMLHEDVSRGVVPYGRQGRIYAESRDPILGRRYLDSLRLGRRHGEIVDFVRTVGIWLFADHEVWIEVFVQDEPERDAPFSIAPVSNVVLPRDGRVLQELPPKEALPEWVQPDDRWGRRIELDRDRLVRVTLPEEYADRRLAKVEEELADIPLMTRPDWFIKQVSGNSTDGPRFDFSEAARTDRLAVLQAALPIGWSGREMLLSTDRNINDFYLYLRELRFLHFLASLRTKAETALREVLTIARNLCGLAVEVTAHDLCTPADISGYIGQFEDGEIPLSRVSDIIFQKPGFARVGRRRIV